jgi:hypothetical protein
LDAPFKIDPASGVLTFGQLKLTLGPKEPLAAFLAGAGASAKNGDDNGAWQHYHLGHDLGDGRKLAVSLGFRNARLVSVRFDYGSESTFGWNGWSEGREIARAVDYQGEIERQLGRRGRFPWGVVDAAYDDKTARATLFVKYE